MYSLYEARGIAKHPLMRGVPLQEVSVSGGSTTVMMRVVGVTFLDCHICGRSSSVSHQLLIALSCLVKQRDQQLTSLLILTTSKSRELKNIRRSFFRLMIK